MSDQDSESKQSPNFKVLILRDRERAENELDEKSIDHSSFSFGDGLLQPFEQQNEQ